MRAPVSVVIPTINAAAQLPDCLLSLMEGLSSGLIREVIISDGGSTDVTKRIAEEAGAIWVEGKSSRGGQLHLGAEAASGDWLLFLHADSVLSPGWSKAAEAQLSGGSAGYGRLRFSEGGVAASFVAGWANLRSRLLGLPCCNQSLLIPVALYQQVGGFPDIPSMENVAMARALKGRLKPMDYTVTTAATYYKQGGWLRRVAREFWMLIRYLFRASPERRSAEQTR